MNATESREGLAATEEAGVARQRRERGGALTLLAGAFGVAGLASSARASAEPVCSPSGPADPAAEEWAIRKVIADMETAWNRSDFRGYMAGFLNPGVVFVSKGKIQTGWQGTLDHYIRDYGKPGARGDLHFYDMTVEFLAPDAAQLVSHFHLKKAIDPQLGVNTRLMRKVDGRWVIAVTHVSSVDPTKAA